MTNMADVLATAHANGWKPTLPDNTRVVFTKPYGQLGTEELDVYLTRHRPPRLLHAWRTVTTATSTLTERTTSYDRVIEILNQEA